MTQEDLPNLVSESQKYAKSPDFLKKKVTFDVLFCEEQPSLFLYFFSN